MKPSIEKTSVEKSDGGCIAVVALLLSLVACVGVAIFVVVALSSDVFKGDRGAKGEGGISGNDVYPPGSPTALESSAVVGHLDANMHNRTERSERIFRDGVRQMTSELRENVRRLTDDLKSVKSNIREGGEYRDRPMNNNWRDAFDARLIVVEHDRVIRAEEIERGEQRTTRLTATVQELRDDMHWIFAHSAPPSPEAAPTAIEIIESDDDFDDKVASQDRETVALIRNQILPRINNDIRTLRFHLQSQASTLTLFARARDEEIAKFRAELESLHHKIYANDVRFVKKTRNNAGDENAHLFYGLTVAE
ncbi:hypothetical protein CYMTET_22558 [Cymbomonas tetramitiformis]|uniref:Uncharacterized protein n=1 Tax=Cymbomonas tetramitiformis TaxID=36881 RepID=A0AAE0L1S8_9CHLO|nr:hypothetical protein CYMTET_22558 [Cymbomonas tetramitiformis]